MRPFWESPAGPKTVFFWGPLGKWGLVLAGIGDLVKRPPQNVSLNQSGVLATTGLIWSRYSVVIIPKNYSLLAVNLVVFLTQGFLIAKHLKWRTHSKVDLSGLFGHMAEDNIYLIAVKTVAVASCRNWTC
ncbi:hypothetical protein AWZ03_008028 [Drosophila navojoa]|uniref:Mitochondrial pyruvate carrier n=1 Tax=Drosophila navojoa TaxID=7232 RepID=A0A484BB43_DRONA|nr:hypothetical protein AWZ03_008028 [Drosophila navojoa]